MTNIHFDRSQVRPTAPDLYGLFFEDINRSSDSGLYPEMIRNRSFEDSIAPAGTTVIEDGAYFVTGTGHKEPFSHGEGDPAWAARHPYTEIPGWYADRAEMKLDHCDRLNPQREVSLAVRFQAGGSITNIGYLGMDVEAGAAYHFYTFWSAFDEGDVTVSLVGKDDAVLAAEKVTVPAGPFTRADLTLTPAASDTEARLVITAEKKLEIKIGFTSLMPEKTFMGHGLREDLCKLLQMTNSKFMRYPGGCIVEGLNKATALRFSEIVGPVWERPSIWNLWHYRATYGFGFHEFLQLCEDLHMEALYVVNCGMSCQAREPEFFEGDDLQQMIDETLWAIEYATGDASTKWGALRAEMGHPEPFTLKYIEIGNENDGPEYDRRYRIFYDILTEKHPEITLISDAHTEDRGLATDYVDEHYYYDWKFFAQSGNVYASYPKDGPKIFVGEYAITRGDDIGTLHAALSETRYLMGCEDNPEVVKLTAYAPLFEHVGYKQWNPNLIFFDGHRAAGLPTLHALGMLGESRGTSILSVSSDSEEIRPEKYGFAGMIVYGNGLRMKPPVADGKETGVVRDILGQWNTEDGDLVSDNTLLPGRKILNATRYPIQKKLINTVFTDEKKTCMKFTARVLMNEETPKFALTFWIHNVKRPGVMDIPADETFHFTDIEYYTWTIDGGKGQNHYLYRYTEQPMTETRELPIKMGEYNEFTVVTRPGGYDCYLNGELVMSGMDRCYHRVDTMVTEDDKYIYVKLLNNSETGEAVMLDFDIPCEKEYEWTSLSGDPTDRNTLEEPDKVHAKTGTACMTECGGASDEEGTMSYYCAPWSFTVVKLKKV